MNTTHRMTRIDLGGNVLFWVTLWNAECAFWPSYHIVVPVLALGLVGWAVGAFWRATDSAWLPT